MKVDTIVWRLREARKMIYAAIHKESKLLWREDVLQIVDNLLHETEYLWARIIFATLESVFEMNIE